MMYDYLLFSFYFHLLYSHLYYKFYLTYTDIRDNL